jgi:hypothetical protein
MGAKYIVEIIAAVMMPGAFGAIIWHRFDKEKRKSIATTKFIQLAGMTLVVPALLILSLEGIFEGGTLGTLWGALLGYLLSGIGSNEKDDKI